MTFTLPLFARELSAVSCYRFVVAACVLSLVLLGFTIPGHVHASEFTGQQTVAAPDLSGDHCPGPLNAPSLGHCGSMHVDTCCVLPPVTTPETTITLVSRAEVPQPSWMAPVPGPPLRPPTFLVA